MPRSAAARKPATVPGRFGAYGGRYVPETLMAALEELESAYEKAKRGKKFQAECNRSGVLTCMIGADVFRASFIAQN